MNYFLDTEFNQNVDPIELISLGIVAQDGREFYATSSEFKLEKCDDWLKKNVIPVMHLKEVYKPNTQTYLEDTLGGIKTKIEYFLKDDAAIRFWGYYADYDWYLFTRFWGFMNLPQGVPSLCMDVKQFQIHLNVPSLPATLQPEHHALVDARWAKVAFDYLSLACK